MDLAADVGMPVDVPLMVREAQAVVQGVQVREGNNWLLEYMDDATPVLFVKHVVEEDPPVIPPEPVIRTAHRATVYFRTNSVDVASLKEALSSISPGGRYVVLGYADPRGSVKFNEKLSLERAKAIAAELNAAGIEVSGTFGRGERELVSGGKRQAFKYDRRVEIKPIADEGETLLEE